MNSTTLFYTILAVAFSLIVFAIYLLLKPKKAEPVKPQTTRTDAIQTKPYEALESKHKYRLERLAELTQHHHELASKPEVKIEDATIVNLKHTIQIQQDQIEMHRREIKRLKEECLKKPYTPVARLKVGDTVRGRVAPSGKKYLTGNIKYFTRRNNICLESGKIIYLEGAKLVE